MHRSDVSQFKMPCPKFCAWVVNRVYRTDRRSPYEPDPVEVLSIVFEERETQRSWMSEHDYTEAEHRLLCQYDLLKDIKEGRRKLIAPPRQPRQPQQQAKPTTAAPAATAGQKLPSRIRLKAVTKPTPTASEQPDSPLPPPSPQSTHPAGASTGVVAKSSVEAAAPATAEPVQATVSRAQLAALLKQKQEQPQPQPDSAVEVEAAEQPVLTPAAEQPAVQPVVRSAPGVTGSLHRASQIAPPSMAEEQQAPARSAAPQEEEIDYGAVSSPEYDVDYDAVSSPEYEVSGRASAAAAAADNAEASNAKQDTQLLTLTPDRKDSRLSPAARYGSRPSPHQASRQPRPNYSAARRRSRSRSPSSSCSPTRRRRSSSRSRSPTRRLRSSSRSRSPTRRRRSSSRSRSPTRRRRSREDGRGLSSRTSRSWRRNSRSRSPRGSRRRSSPDYGIGAGPGVSGRQQAQSPSRSGSPTPDLRQRGRNKGRQQSRQKHPTLFVGDLPPAGFASEDLHGLFAAYGWCIISARVQGSQCYGFVEFENRVDAEEALHLIETKDEGFIVNGTSIRASWAKGSMPDWKKGKAVLMPRDKSVGLEGLEAYEHPTARMMRLQAAAVAAMSGLAVPGSDVGGAASDGQLPVVQTAARQLIDYGDL